MRMQPSISAMRILQAIVDGIIRVECAGMPL